MRTLTEVRLWGRTIGAVLLEDNALTASFQYDPDFSRSGIEISPLMMPLSERVYSFPSLGTTSFHGLPGLLSDSLPDRFGTALIDTWLARQGRLPGSFNAAERLCYTGTRGMGALEYHPSAGPEPGGSELLQVADLVELASRILEERSGLQGSLSIDRSAESLRDILRVGTSAGGARPKAVIAWNPLTNEVRSGQVDAGENFQYWLLKFDGVREEPDLGAPGGYGAVEYAYYLMAIDCGISMSDCRLFEEGGRRHFMTRRFDRIPGGGKLHMQSLGAMAHLDYEQPGAYGYEQALQVIRRLDLPYADVEQMYRRMMFNIIARNHDDHVKNIAFLMDKSGQWSLAPAFDLTFSFNPDGKWTAGHQMTINGKRDNFILEDFKRCASTAAMKHSRFRTIIEETREAVSRWSDFADEAGVSRERRDRITGTHRIDPF